MSDALEALVRALPAELTDTTTLVSLGAVLVMVLAAWGLAEGALDYRTPSALRFLFVWHAFDAMIHFVLEGSFLYNCFYSALDLAGFKEAGGMSDVYHPDPPNFLGTTGLVHGAQAGAVRGVEGPMAMLWMVYARADKRWAGVDLGVVSLELLTVFIVAPMCVWVCYDIARKNPRANVLMIILATAELYGGFMTFCPEWLTGNVNLDTSNFTYKWFYLVFFNMLWVFAPLYSIFISATDIMDALRVRGVVSTGKKDS